MAEEKSNERRQSERRKSIPMSSAISSYAVDQHFLVIPQDLSQDFGLCRVHVANLDGYGAWLELESDTHEFPDSDELLLIAFDKDWVITHHSKVTRRKASRILVDAPSVTERERSQLAPSTGRHDYRVKVNQPVRVRTEGDRTDKNQPLRLARLVDLSRGGMALLAPSTQVYKEGERLAVRVVGWDHPIHIDAVVARVTEAEEEGKNRIAVMFPEAMTLLQRESISTFIIQAQRRDAVARALPTDLDDALILEA